MKTFITILLTLTSLSSYAVDLKLYSGEYSHKRTYPQQNEEYNTTGTIKHESNFKCYVGDGYKNVELLSFTTIETQGSNQIDYQKTELKIFRDQNGNLFWDDSLIEGDCYLKQHTASESDKSITIIKEKGYGAKTVISFINTDTIQIDYLQKKCLVNLGGHMGCWVFAPGWPKEAYKSVLYYR